MLRNVTSVLVALVIAVAHSGHAQTSGPTFEVASIKPAQQRKSRDVDRNGTGTVQGNQCHRSLSDSVRIQHQKFSTQWRAGLVFVPGVEDGTPFDQAISFS